MIWLLVRTCVFFFKFRSTKGTSTPELPHSHAHTGARVGPAGRHEAVLAEALEGAGGVDAAGVLTRADTSRRVRTLVNVWKTERHSENVALLVQSSYTYVCLWY